MEQVGFESTGYFDEHGIDHLLDAAKVVLFEQLEGWFSQRKSACMSQSGDVTYTQHSQLGHDNQVLVVHISSALCEYLGYVSDIPKANISDGGIEWMVDFSLACVKVFVSAFAFYLVVTVMCCIRF